MKKNDSKYFYTSQLMNQALLSLLEKKRYRIYYDNRNHEESRRKSLYFLFALRYHIRTVRRNDRKS